MVTNAVTKHDLILFVRVLLVYILLYQRRCLTSSFNLIILLLCFLLAYRGLHSGSLELEYLTLK